jgi:uncharacterized protein YchJ
VGKKTTKFIEDIDSKQTACKKSMEEYILCCEECAALDARSYNAQERMNSRFKAIAAQYKNDVQAINKALSVDPEYKQAEKEHNDLDREAWKICRKRDLANNAISDYMDQIDRALKAFETFINKKAKSKNPFKSKKSIPAARDFIEASKTFLENSQAFFKSIGGFIWNVTPERG